MTIVPSSIVVEFTQKDTAAAVKFRCKDCQQEFTLFRPLSTKRQLAQEIELLGSQCLLTKCAFRKTLDDPAQLINALWDIFENVEKRAKLLSGANKRGYFEGHDVACISLRGLIADLDELYVITARAYGIRVNTTRWDKTIANLIREDRHPENPQYVHSLIIMALERYYTLINNLYKRVHNEQPKPIDPFGASSKLQQGDATE